MNSMEIWDLLTEREISLWNRVGHRCEDQGGYAD